MVCSFGVGLTRSETRAFSLLCSELFTLSSTQSGPASVFGVYRTKPAEALCYSQELFMSKLWMLFWLLPGLALGQEAKLPLDETWATGSLDDSVLELPAEPEAPKKIPDAALGLSLGLTSVALMIGGELAGVGKNAELPALRVVGIGVAAAGVAMFPSAGHVYAGEWRRVQLGVGLRSGAMLAGGALLHAALQNDSPAISTATFGVAGLLGAVVLFDAGLEVFDSEDAVKRANQKKKK